MSVSNLVMRERSEVLCSYPVIVNLLDLEAILQGAGAVWLLPEGWMDDILKPVDGVKYSIHLERDDNMFDAWRKHEIDKT